MNDSAVMGVGGSVTSFDDLTPVRMVRENIQVDYAKRHVTTEFVVKNTGETTLVTMGFPEEGFGDVQAPEGKSKSWFEAFKSWVDGKPIQVSLKRAEGDDMMYRQWWVKQVDFAHGQTRKVRNAYVTRFSSSTNMDKGIYYILGSGRPWAGKIGNATIQFEMSGLKRGTIYFASPKPTAKVGQSLIWKYKNFEPEEDMRIHVRHIVPDPVMVPQSPGSVKGFDGESKYVR